MGPVVATAGPLSGTPGSQLLAGKRVLVVDDQEGPGSGSAIAAPAADALETSDLSTGAEPGETVPVQPPARVPGTEDVAPKMGERLFDTINLRNVLYLVEDPVAFLQKALRHLRPGGRILVSGPL